MTSEQTETSGQAAHRVHYQAVANGHLGTRPVPYDELGPLGECAWEDIGRAAQPAPELAALRKRLGEAAALHLLAAAERDQLRRLLDEIGVMAANAPEDGDSFAVCEQIAMMAAGAGVPDDGRHPDGCTCQFCREDEREAQAQDDDPDDPDRQDGGD